MGHLANGVKSAGRVVLAFAAKACLEPVERPVLSPSKGNEGNDPPVGGAKWSRSQ